MTRIAIVYSTGHGHTGTVARQADLIEITASQLLPTGRWHDDVIMGRLASADAIVFGAPTYMGSAHGLFKLFLEAAFTPWLDQMWKDKIGAGFTNSGSRSGDKLIRLSGWRFSLLR
jgi:NAD(P)H dehydrogenase (quinone)